MELAGLKAEKSTLRFLIKTHSATKSLIAQEFGAERARLAKISFSRKMYFTLGRCWPEHNKIVFNLAWVVLNRKTPEYVWALLVHEVAHLGDSTHGGEFEQFCQRYGVDTGDILGARPLPPVAWLICSTCGDNQGALFSTRLSPGEVSARFSGTICRSCGAEVEYRELSDKGFRKVSAKVKKLRVYGTNTWESLRGITN